MGGQKELQKTNEQTNEQTNEKTTFLEIFFTVAHLLIKLKLFCFYQNFISLVVQKNQGGTKSVTNNKRTNKQTPLTIIVARQDSFIILGIIIDRYILEQVQIHSDQACGKEVVQMGALS